MDINDSIAQYKCLQCEKPMKKIQDLKKHIQKFHTKVPEFRCIFCVRIENRFSTMKRDHMYQVRFVYFMIVMKIVISTLIRNMRMFEQMEKQTKVCWIHVKSKIRFYGDVMVYNINLVDLFK